MKKNLFYTCTFVLMITLAHAQTNYLTVSNDINSPGMYNNLQEALNFARDNPISGEYYTILVSGTPNSYGSVNIETRVTLIGAGYYPVNQYEYASVINELTIVDGSSGTKVMGFQITTISCADYSYSINNITIIRNRITNTITKTGTGIGGPHSNWFIANNILNTIDGSSRHVFVNAIVTNNIITGQLIRFPSGHDLTVNNNIFLEYTGDVFSEVYTATIQNNIFDGPSPAGAENSTLFSENVSTGPLGDFGFTPLTPNNTDGGGNIPDVPQADIFIDGDNPGDPFDYANNYNLVYPDIDDFTGTDGTQVGIYGGIFIFPDAGDVPYLYRASPQIPQIIYMNITNTTIPANGTLIIDVEAKIQE